MGWFVTFVLRSPAHVAAIVIWAATLAAAVYVLQIWCNTLLETQKRQQPRPAALKSVNVNGNAARSGARSGNAALTAAWVGAGSPMHLALSRHDKLHLRKAFHVLVVLIVVPALLLVPDFLRLALAVAFAALVLVELLRNGKIPPFGSAADGFLLQFRDDRDPGVVFVTHIYLLLACACPIWMSSGFAAYAGVLSIGVGDAAASVCGLRFGKTPWPGGRTSKTLEGSFASLITQLALVQVLSSLGAGPACGIQRALPALLAGVVMEAATLQVDNLVVPPMVFVMLLHAEQC